jgi:hypothetical protein
MTREKLGMIIPNILHYYLNFFSPISKFQDLALLEKVLEIYSEKFAISGIILTKIDIENFYLLGKDSGILQYNFFNKIAKLLSINKISFPNEIVDKVGAEETNPMIYSVGKFLHGFSQNQIENFEFWDKMITKFKEINIAFGKKGSEFRYIYYYIFNIFKEPKMKLIMEMFIINIFNKEFEDLYKSPEIIEIISTLPKEKNEFLGKTAYILNNFDKLFKNQKNEKQVLNFVNVVVIISGIRREIFTLEVKFNSNLGFEYSVKSFNKCHKIIKSEL